MSFPPNNLEWATETNYPAGADPWSGLPTKTEPTATIKDYGFVPEQPASAEELNYLLHYFASTANALAAAIIQRFDHTRDMAATISSGVCSMFGAPKYNKKKGWWVAPPNSGSVQDVYYTSNFGADWVAMSAGLAAWSVGSTICGLGINNNPASAKYGDMVLASRAGAVTTRVYDAATETWSTVATGAGGWTHVEHDPVNNTWIMLGTSGGSTIVCRNAPDTTYVFTARALAGVTSAAWDDVGKLVVSDTGVALFASSSTVFNRSTDGGTTWAAVTPPSGPASAYSYCWVPARQEFVMVAADGNVYASPDGSSWTLRSTVAGSTAYVFRTGVVQDVEAFGSVMWATWGTASMGGGAAGGIAVSKDGGLTWALCGNASCKTDTGVSSNSPRGRIIRGADAVVAWFVKGTTDANGFAFLKGLDFIGR